MSEQNLIANESNPSLPVAVDRSHPALKELAKLTVSRQLGVMLGLAFSVAIGVAVVLWSQTQTYDLLLSGLNDADSAEVVEALQKSGATYKIDAKSGAILVPPDKIRELKLQLAAQGLPRTNTGGSGYDLLDKEEGFGTSKNVEQMRFQRALEGEIAKTITTIQNIKSARVLLALPKQSVFVREHKKPSASVIVNLYQGRSLNKGQVDSIVHLVASSVPLMEPEQVTVADQRGQLLNSDANGADAYLSSKQLDYKSNVENHLMDRINNILTPLVGSEGLRTQVSADVDFTVTEQTQERFNPNEHALRSEQINDSKNETSTTQGVPGALTNQPPAAGKAPEELPNDKTKTTSTPVSENKSATRNFELDKTITHTKLSAGELKRLSVAVVVDNKRLVQEGETISQAYSQEEINRFTDLVKQAIGFNAERGDQVTVTNSAFRVIDEVAELPAAPVWEQVWFMDLLKQVAAALVVLFLVFGVLRPTMRGLVGRSEEAKKAELEAANAAIPQFDENGNPIASPLGNEENSAPPGLPNSSEDLLLLESPQTYEKRLEYVRKLADEDPQLVAQVLKIWLKEEAQ